MNRPIPLRLPVLLLAVFPLVLSCGCSRFGAYFNTFYFAKKYYNQAELMVANSTANRLPPEASALYDKSIEKSEKVLAKGGGWWAGVDDALFLIGAASYGKRDFDGALAVFDRLYREHPESEHIPEALFLTGLSHHRKREYAKADEFFEKIAAEHPKFERSDEILFLVGKGYEEDEEDSLAVATYDRLVERYPKSDHREEALRRVAEIHFEAGREQESLEAYQRLLEGTRDETVYFEKSLRAGEIEVRLGDYDAALRRYLTLLPEEPEKSKETPPVWIHMAEAYNLKGEHEKAVEILEAVGEHFPSISEATEAKFQLGYTFEVYLRDIERARVVYEEAASLKVQSVFQKESADRLKNLQELKELQTKAVSQEEIDRGTRAEAAFKVAELMYFGSGDEDEVLLRYSEVDDQYPDTPAGARAAFAVAWIRLNEVDDQAEALKNFEHVIDRYPLSAQADYAARILEDHDALSPKLAGMVKQAKETKRLQDLEAKLRADSLSRARADSMARREARAAGAAADTAAGFDRPPMFEGPFPTLPDTAFPRPDPPPFADSSAALPESLLTDPRGGSAPDTSKPARQGP